MFGLDKIFDLNGDEKLDSFEKAIEYRFLDEMTSDEGGVFADAGLDYEELEAMDPKERRQVLESAGLKPKDFDF